MIIEKITSEEDVLNQFRPGETVLPPLVVRRVVSRHERVGVSGKTRDIDLRVELALGTDTEGDSFAFAIESKKEYPTLQIQHALDQVKTYPPEMGHPMIVVPYLSPERLDELEAEQVSGVDLCGNGIVIVPDRLYICRSGQPNLYRQSGRCGIRTPANPPGRADADRTEPVSVAQRPAGKRPRRGRQVVPGPGFEGCFGAGRRLDRVQKAGAIVDRTTSVAGPTRARVG